MQENKKTTVKYCITLFNQRRMLAAVTAKASELLFDTSA
jgi:hypothetical protein